MIKVKLAIILLCSIPLCLYPQSNYSRYNFLNLQDNQFKNTDKSNYYTNLMDKFADLCLNNKDRISVIHIGDSHIQGGYYTNEIKKNFQNYFIADSIVNPGLIFPYSAANTNNPPDYKTNSSGNWNAFKAINNDTKYKLGITGVGLSTSDTSASLTISLRDYYPMKQYAFNNARIFCSYPDSSYKIKIHPAGKITRTESYLNIAFKGLTDSMKIKIEKIQMKDSASFNLTGIQLDNTNHPFSYHAAGVNGAKAKSYLSCELVPEQLRMLDPDWVIISLGTNEAYSQHFKGKAFERNMKKLVRQIQNNTDSCWILLNTPGDAMYHEHEWNPDNKKASDMIINVAREMNCSYWNFYNVMGGNHSIDKWYSSDLTAKDKLHLNKDGYQLKGNLFFEAFLNSFQPFFNSKLKKK